MQPQNLSTILPITIPLEIAPILFPKPKRSRALHANRLSIIALITLLIGVGLTFALHNPVGPFAYVGFGLIAGLVISRLGEICFWSRDLVFFNSLDTRIET